MKSLKARIERFVDGSIKTGGTSRLLSTRWIHRKLFFNEKNEFYGILSGCFSLSGIFAMKNVSLKMMLDLIGRVSLDAAKLFQLLMASTMRVFPTGPVS